MEGITNVFRKYNLVVIFVLSIILPSTRTEMFTALVDLEKVLYAENSVAGDLREYIKSEEIRLNRLKEIADDYENHSKEALSDPEKYLANPVNAFLLVKRFTTDWEGVIDKLIRGNSTGQNFLDTISTQTSLFPSPEDLTGAATALLRLQDTYALPTEQIAKGDLQGIVNSPELTAEECFELGKHAYQSNDFYHTILWMEEALERVDQEGPSPTANKATILDYLAYSMSMQGNINHALNLTIDWLKLEPDHVRAQNNKKYYQQVLLDEEVKRRKGDEAELNEVPHTPEVRNKRILDEYRQSEEFATYEALCRGEETQVDPLAHTYTCRYKRHHPMFYINPLYEETLYHDPWLVVYHNVLSDSEMATVKKLATPRLNRATVQNPSTGELEFAKYRVSKSAWMKDTEDQIIERISHRTKAFTNLTLDTVEELQVVNYGIGGHYEPHYDFARSDEAGSFEEWRGNRILTAIFYKDDAGSFDEWRGNRILTAIFYPNEMNTFDEWRGNRILTAIFYMSEVKAGGLTVFPQLGAKVSPEKGSVAVWYNLMASGEGDYRTRHAGCPVLTGSKWVANKWFHERGQEFARKCDLNPDV